MALPDTYRYIAVFAFAEDGVHITFPDLPGCVSFGKDEDEAGHMAREVLKLHLYGMEQDGEDIPAPSKVKSLSSHEMLADNEAFVMVEAFMPSFRERQNRRCVEKTLEIPYWLNLEAEQCGLDFSRVLQDALKKELHILA